MFNRRAGARHAAARSLRSWLRAAFDYGRNDLILGQSRGRPDLVDA